MKTPQTDRTSATQAALRSNLEGPAAARSPLDLLSRQAQGPQRRADSALAVRKDRALDGSFDRALRDAGGDRERREEKLETEPGKEKDEAPSKTRKKEASSKADAEQETGATATSAQAASVNDAPDAEQAAKAATIAAGAGDAPVIGGVVLAAAQAAKPGAVAAQVNETKRSGGLLAKDGAAGEARTGAGTPQPAAAGALIDPTSSAIALGQSSAEPTGADREQTQETQALPSDRSVQATISKAPVERQGAIQNASNLAAFAPIMAASARESTPIESTGDSRGEVWSLGAIGPSRASVEKAAAAAGVPVASPPVEQQLSEGMTAALRHIPSPAGQRVVQIRLEPRDFGSVRVQLRVAGDAVAVRLVVGTKQAAEAVTRSMQDLRESVQRRGLRVESMGVEIDAALAPVATERGAITGQEDAGTPLAMGQTDDAGAERSNVTPGQPARSKTEGGAFETLTLRLDQVA